MLTSRWHRQPLWRTKLNRHSKEILKSTVNPYRIDSIRSPHARESKTVLDSGFHAVDSGFQVLDSRFFCQWNFGFLIPIVSGIPDSLSCIPDFKAQNSGFRVLDSRFFLFVEPGFLIPIVSGIPDSKTQVSALQVLDSGFFCQWNLDLWFQSLVGFRILFGLHKQKFPGFRNPESLT